jgi:hypothetical protein
MFPKSAFEVMPNDRFETVSVLASAVKDTVEQLRERCCGSDPISRTMREQLRESLSVHDAVRPSPFGSSVILETLSSGSMDETRV